MLPLILPGEGNQIADAKRVTVVGGAGAGKSRFVRELVRLNHDRAYCLSAVSAPFAGRVESEMPGSIDMLYRQAVERMPYLKGEAVSQLSRLVYLLVADEFELLLSQKYSLEATEYRDGLHSSAQSLSGAEPESRGGKEGRGGLKVTPSKSKLERVQSVWQRVFPGHRIVMKGGMMWFATEAGTDLIGVDMLSRSEMAVLYYAAAVLYAPRDGVVVVDDPSLFLHPATLAMVWDIIESLRPDCTFVYDTVDADFVNTRTRHRCIWVKSYDATRSEWDYALLTPDEMQGGLSVDLVGTRRPVLFVEGDFAHSIDSRLYALVFPAYTVRPLGSCDKVIETVRAFGGMRQLHQLDSRGIVDRDRRTDQEVGYLRRKGVMVADVAEVENLFLLEDVVRAMARRRGVGEDEVMRRVKRNVVAQFRKMYEAQALQHVRYRVKREVETKIDARFTCITAMELHLQALHTRLRPRKQYTELCRLFKAYTDSSDYASILKVFNHKPMLADCGVAQMLGFHSRDEYITDVIRSLRSATPEAEAIRSAMLRSFSGKYEV